MTVTQRGKLSESDEAELEDVALRWHHAAEVQREMRAIVVQMIARSSYREVARLTGFSTNTLQRWKREAGQ